MQEPSALTLVFANTLCIEETQNVIFFFVFQVFSLAGKMDDILHYRANGVIVLVLYITLYVAANEGGNDSNVFLYVTHTQLYVTVFFLQ